jgi:nicotinamidase-related amidase
LKSETWGTQFHENIDTQNDVILEKHRVSAFFETSLTSILQENKIESILIA